MVETWDNFINFDGSNNNLYCSRSLNWDERFFLKIEKKTKRLITPSQKQTFETQENIVAFAMCHPLHMFLCHFVHFCSAVIQLAGVLFSSRVFKSRLNFNTSSRNEFLFVSTRDL